jgi:hypothetical protein
VLQLFLFFTGDTVIEIRFQSKRQLRPVRVLKLMLMQALSLFLLPEHLRGIIVAILVYLLELSKITPG